MSGVRTFGGEQKPPLDENLLEHHGVKGMHWGARKNDYPGASARTNHHAHRDAKEFARAKMFYGEGAGTRRKLIKAKVEANKKRDPTYAKAFDHHLARQDMSEHANKAQSERTRKNVAKTTKKTGGALARHLTGEMGTAAAVIALGAAGVAFSRTPRGQAMMRATMSKANTFMADRRRQQQVSDLLKNAGLNNFNVR